MAWCSWDTRRRRWVFVTHDQRARFVRDYEKGLRSKLREAKSDAGRGPKRNQISQLKSYATRAAKVKRDRDMDEKKKAFRIKSDVNAAYFRLLLAYESNVLAGSIEEHLKTLRKLPWSD